MKKLLLIVGIPSFVLLLSGTSAFGRLTGLAAFPAWISAPTVTHAESTGRDGDLVVTNPGTIVNQYATLAVNVSAGASGLLVTYPGGANGLRPDLLAAGDLILIVQMAGATIDSSDSINYGQVTSLNNAGRYEYVTVSRVDGGLITVNPPCGGLLNDYSVSGKVQIIRVPRYNSLTINSGGSITAPGWNGSYGGIVAIQVDNGAVINGSIDVSATGFRGGLSPAVGGATGRNDYVTGQQDFGAEKGEGIAGYQQGYDQFNGRYGRGAAANAGGGGTAHNAGGGGGANGNNGSTWSGFGVMDGAAVGASAWLKDPAYIANGNKLTASSGGGRGGYSYAVQNADALTIGPDRAEWGGDNRRNVGGIGGRPNAQDLSSRIFMGGGGGGGAQNDLSGGNGGNAGGMIYIIAKSVSGSGSLVANGANGGDTQNQNRDGAGGGGAGGTIVVYSDTLTGISAQAKGGRGGNQNIPIVPNETESQGPGGGGGGGFVAFKGGTITADVSGGVNGVTRSISLTEFPSNGATGGASGLVQPSIGAIPYCSAVSDLAITKTNAHTSIIPGVPTTYTIVVTNNGPSRIYGVDVVDQLPTGFIPSSKSWTCAASTGSSCVSAGSNGDLVTKVNLLSQGTVTFKLTGTVDPALTGSIGSTAQVTVPAGGTDPVASNNTANDTDILMPTADLSLSMISKESVFIPGTTVTFQILVTSSGPSVASGFSVVDQLPSSVSLVSATCTASGGNCGVNSSTGNLLQFTGASLLPTAGNLLSLTIVGYINPSSTGNLINTASLSIPSFTPSMGTGSVTIASSGFFDPNPESNSATVEGQLSPQANLVISKSNSQSTVISGTSTTYRIVVSNLGPSDASGFDISDPVPSVIKVSNVVCASNGGNCGTNKTVGNSVNYSGANLPVGTGKSITLDVTGLVSPDATGVLSNTATVNLLANSTFTDQDVVSNSATDSDQLLLQADLSANITGPSSSLFAGSKISYTIEVVNRGPGLASAANVSMPLPSSLGGATWTCQATAGSTCAAASGTDGINTQVNLAVNGKATFAVTATVSRSFGGSLVNLVTVTPQSGMVDPVMGNNTSTASTTVILSIGPTFIIAEGLTKWTVSQIFRTALDAGTIARDALGLGRLNNQTISLPVRAGAIDLFNAMGEVNHTGGLALTKDAKRVQLLGMTIDTTRIPAVLSAVVVVSSDWNYDNPGSTLGRLDLAELTLPPSVTLPMKPGAFNTLYIHEATVTMTSQFAGLLNSRLGVSNFAAGSDLGTVSFSLVGVPERQLPGPRQLQFQ